MFREKCPFKTLKHFNNCFSVLNGVASDYRANGLRIGSNLSRDTESCACATIELLAGVISVSVYCSYNRKQEMCVYLQGKAGFYQVRQQQNKQSSVFWVFMQCKVV